MCCCRSCWTAWLLATWWLWTSSKCSACSGLFGLWDSSEQSGNNSIYHISLIVQYNYDIDYCLTVVAYWLLMEVLYWLGRGSKLWCPRAQKNLIFGVFSYTSWQLPCTYFHIHHFTWCNSSYGIFQIYVKFASYHEHLLKVIQLHRSHRWSDDPLHVYPLIIVNQETGQNRQTDNTRTQIFILGCRNSSENYDCVLTSYAWDYLGP